MNPGAMLLGGAEIIQGIASTYEPAKRAIAYNLNKTLPNAVLPVDVLIAQMFRGLIDIEAAQEDAAKQGIGSEAFLRLVHQYKQLLRVDDYVRLYFRHEITYKELVDYLYQLGVTGEIVDQILVLAEYFPPPEDLIRFALRDVYSPEVVKKFQMTEDLPPKFLEEAAKIGISTEQATNYWAAHWVLPSPGQGFEMYQRGIISNDELKMLLKSLDIMPFWRDRMIKLSYKTLTRVDVRRMWDLGVITEYSELCEKYRDLGYSPEDAINMADFTIAITTNEMEGITRANIGSSYMNGIISEDVMRMYLDKLGKSETFTSFWYEHYVYSRALKEVKAREQEILDMFIDGGMNYDEVRKTLVEEGANLDYIEYVLRKVQALKKKRVKYPDLTTVIRWYNLGVIDRRKYVNYMMKLGYDEETITYYLVEIEDVEVPPKRKYLSIKQYTEFLDIGLLNLETYTSTLLEAGYKLDDINMLIAQYLEGKKENEAAT